MLLAVRGRCSVENLLLTRKYISTFTFIKDITKIYRKKKLEGISEIGRLVLNDRNVDKYYLELLENDLEYFLSLIKSLLFIIPDEKHDENIYLASSDEYWHFVKRVPQKTILKKGLLETLSQILFRTFHISPQNDNLRFAGLVLGEYTNDYSQSWHDRYYYNKEISYWGVGLVFGVEEIF